MIPYSLTCPKRSSNHQVYHISGVNQVQSIIPDPNNENLWVDTLTQLQQQIEEVSTNTSKRLGILRQNQEDLKTKLHTMEQTITNYPYDLYRSPEHYNYSTTSSEFNPNNSNQYNDIPISESFQNVQGVIESVQGAIQNANHTIKMLSLAKSVLYPPAESLDINPQSHKPLMNGTDHDGEC